MSKIALFAGSFDPFTKGHKDIIDRALASVADEVVVAVGVNCQKACMFSFEERVQAIKNVYKDNPKVSVKAYDGLTTDYAKEIGADFLLRGVRSTKDFEYERDIAEVNRRLTGIETILMLSAPELSCVSSSVARELLSYNKDIKDFLP